MMYLNDGSTKFVSASFTIPSAYDNSGSSANDNTASSTDNSTDSSVNDITDYNSYDILVTTSPNLLGAVSLDGTIVNGDIYVLYRSRHRGIQGDFLC